MAANDKVLPGDWNPIQAKIQKVIGTPDGTTVNYGYNTAVSSSQVAANGKITGAQWNALRTDINKAYTLQTGSASDLTTRASTDIIKYTDLTTISAKADTADTNRTAVSTGALNYVAGPGYANIGGSWNGVLTPINNTITWADNNAFRGFWNGGGRIIITGSRSGGDATSQNQGWSNLLSNMGSIVLTRTGMFQSGQGWNGTFYNSFNTTGAYGTNYTNWTEAFRIYDQDTNYTANYAQVYLYWNTADNFTKTSLSVLVYYVDNHAALGAGPDYVNGNTYCNVAIYYPFTETKPNNY